MPICRSTRSVRALAALAVVLVVAACGTSGASPSATGAPAASASAAPAVSPSLAPGAASPSAQRSAIPSDAASASVPASLVPSGAPSASASASPSAGVATRLPVVTCTVTDGAIQGPLPTPMATSLEVVVPATLASHLAVYGVENEQLIVGPRDWRCTGLVGADASSHVTIVDPADPTMGIVVDSAPGAPYSGVLDLACPLFPDANQLLHATFGFDCPKQHVAGEQVTMQTGEIARFVDPPGVKSVGALSGGTVPVQGALLYHTAPDNVILAFQISCALPQADAELCTTVVNDWIERVATAYDIAR